MADRSEYYREYYQKNKEKIQEYKRNYSKNYMYKNFKKVCAFVDKDKAKAFEEKLIKDKINVTDFINKAIDQYLNN